MKVTKSRLDKSRFVRPVKCFLCRGQMYYSNDERFVPEVYIEVMKEKFKPMESLYAHLKCWKKFTTERRRIKGMTFDNAERIRKAISRGLKNAIEQKGLIGTKQSSIASATKRILGQIKSELCNIEKEENEKKKLP